MLSENIESLLDLTGKVAMVTGSGRGIGKACAICLANAGAKVVVSDRTEANARHTADEILAMGGQAIPVTCDVLSDADLAASVETAVAAFGTINILVNNAGLGGGGRENIFKIDREYVERIYAINVVAPWRLCQLVAPYMQKSGSGSIINISSMSSINADPDMAIYASSKAALNHLSANLAHDLGPMGIRINCIAPGATRTDALASILTPEMESHMLSHTPLKRLGEVADIAHAMLFLASPASDWISGQTLMVNGGGVQTLRD